MLQLRKKQFRMASLLFLFSCTGQKTGLSIIQGPPKANHLVMSYFIEQVLWIGAFLCNDNYYFGYCNSQHMGFSPDRELHHTGFRCVREAD